MPKIDLYKVDDRIGSGFPAPFDEPCFARKRQRLSDAGGATQFVSGKFTGI